MNTLAGFLGSDLYAVQFANFTEVATELERREAETTRELMAATAFSFDAIGFSKINFTDKLVAETMTKIPMFVKSPLTLAPVSSEAWNSIKRRIEIYGDGVTKLKPTLLADVLNDRFGTLGEKKVLAIHTDGKLRAIRSQEYLVAPMASVFPELRDGLEKRFGEIKFIAGDLTYSRLQVVIGLPNANAAIKEAYDTHFQTALRLEMSDTGDSANRIIPCFIAGKRLLALSEGVEMIHRKTTVSDKEKVEKWLDATETLFARYVTGLQLFMKAMATLVPSDITLEEAIPIAFAGMFPNWFITEIVAELAVYPLKPLYDLYDFLLMAFAAWNRIEEGKALILESYFAKLMQKGFPTTIEWPAPPKVVSAPTSIPMTTGAVTETKVALSA